MHILIVDNEIRPAKLIAGILEKNYPHWNSPLIVTNEQEALQTLQQQVIDLLFLDIEMPEMTGFDLLENINLTNIPAVIFTTAHKEYAARAFRVNAIDYLLKPVLSSQLIGAVEKVRNTVEQKLKTKTIPDHKTKITVYEGQSYHIIYLDQLIRVEADGNYARFIMVDNQRLLSSKGLKFYEELLEKYGFLRCHKSHLVNLQHIKSYTLADGGYINLTNEERLPLAVSKKRILLDKLELS